MKTKILKIFFIFITLSAISLAGTLNAALLSEIENNFFGVDYPKDSDLGRIQRIEKILYGTTQTGDLAVRLNKIASDTGTVVKKKEMSKAEKALPNNLSQQMNNNQSPEQKKEDYVAEDSSVNYPIVDKMEQKVFNKVYSKENIYTRLDRLEKKAFNTTYNKEVLNSRVERLSDTLLYSEKLAQKEDNDILPYPQQIKRNTDKYQNSTGTYADDNMTVLLASIERNAFGNVYMNDSVGQRLNRLENHMLGKTFPNETPKNRLERLSSVAMAQNNSYIYDNNKTMRNVATFSQIGGILLMILAMIL